MLKEPDWAPTFIGIGAEKSATTWCHAALNEHPQVCMGRPKEINYFNYYHDRGEAWYRRHFHRPERAVLGEISPKYMADPRVCDRLAADYPDVRILAVLRNPLDRAVSHVAMDLQNAKGGVSKLPAVAWREQAGRERKYVARSLYYRALKPYFDSFPREQIRVLFFDDLRANPAKFVARLFESAGADPLFLPSPTQSVSNKTQDYRSPLLFKTLRLVSRCGNRLPLVRRGMELIYRRTTLRERVLSRLMVDAGRPNVLFADVFGPRELETITHDVEQLRCQLNVASPSDWRLSRAA